MKLYKTSFYIILSVLIIISFFEFSCQKKEKEENLLELKVGLYNNNPKIFKDSQGKAQGIFIEILEDIAKKENWRTEYIFAEWSDLVEMLRKGEIDLLPDFPAIEGMDTLIKLNKVPVLRSWIEIYDDKYDHVQKLEDLKGLKVGVLKSSLQETLFKDKSVKNFDINWTLISFNTYNEGVEMLLDDRIDVLISNRFFFFSDLFNKHNLYSTQIIFHPTNLHFASNKDNLQIIQKIDENLSIMLNDPNSIYYKVQNKYFLKFKSDYRKFKLLVQHLFGFITLTIITLIIVFYQSLRKKNKTLRAKNDELESANTNLILTNYQKEISNSKLTDANESLNDISNSLQIGLYRIIVDSSMPLDKYGMFKHKIIYCNRIFTQITGISEDELKSNAYLLTEIIHNEDIKSFINSNLEVSIKKTKFRWKGRIKIKDETKWVIFDSTHRVKNQYETVWTGTITDITREVLKNKEQKRDKQLFNTLAEISPSGIFRTDKEGATTYVNPQWMQLSGIGNSEAMGYGWLSAVHPEDRERISREWNQIYPFKNAGYSEYRFLRPDGSIKWVVGYVAPEVIDDELIGYIGTITDITEIKESQEVLSENEKKYRMITENITDVVWLADLNLKVHYVSPSIITLTGETVEEHLAKKIEEKLPQESLRLVSSILIEETQIEQQKNKDINRTRTVECQHYKKDGSLIWLSITVSFIRDKEGNPIQIQGVSRNIDNLKKAQLELISAKEKAEESDRLKSSFLANMSHEIRTPMNGILGFAQLLKNPELNQENQLKFVEIIQKSGERMLNIINDIIDISKIESGQMEIVKTEVNINLILQELHSFFKNEAESKQIKLIYSKNFSLANKKISTDSDKLYAIITNLIKNALKFTEKGQIQFGVSIEENELLFFVKDTGVGINPEKINIIFERFRQGSEKYSRSYEGAGLGLYITKSFVEILGGKIWVESELNVGSTFYFTLPYPIENKIANNKNEEIFIEDIEQKIKSKNKKIKVLITEDEDVSSMLLFQFIDFFSREIIYATNGIEAIEMIEKHKDIDLILMDLKMPLMDGFEATTKIRELNKNVIIIAQSAFAMIGDDKKAIEAGCNAYISKPINKHKLYNLVYNFFFSKN